MLESMIGVVNVLLFTFDIWSTPPYLIDDNINPSSGIMVNVFTEFSSASINELFSSSWLFSLIDPPVPILMAILYVGVIKRNVTFKVEFDVIGGMVNWLLIRLDLTSFPPYVNVATSKPASGTNVNVRVEAESISSMELFVINRLPLVIVPPFPIRNVIPYCLIFTICLKVTLKVSFEITDGVVYLLFTTWDFTFSPLYVKVASSKPSAGLIVNTFLVFFSASTLAPSARFMLFSISWPPDPLNILILKLIFLNVTLNVLFEEIAGVVNWLLLNWDFTSKPP